MSYRYGQVSSMFELLDNIVDVMSNDGWTTIRSYNLTYNGVVRLGGVLLKGKGDGNDALYITIAINPANFKEYIIDASAGADNDLEIWEQPGSIQQWNKIEDAVYPTEGKIPAFSITDNERFNYFIFSNTYRVVVICKLSIDYQSMYIGFLNPISSERQYPYPMYVAGNNIVSGTDWPSNLTSSFVFPNGGSGWLRRADGVWREFKFPYSDSLDYKSQGALFPYDCNNVSLVPNYVETATTDVDFLLIPIILHTSNPVDMNGTLRGVYWISGTRDIASEQTVVINTKQYMVFDSGMNRGTNSYFCIELEA